MDLFELKRLYGSDLVLMGNIEYDRIAEGPEAAESEIRTKVGMGKRGGGYIYHADHSVPPTIGLETYRHVLDMARRYGVYSQPV
jgi:uroporphyrinogen-III decarboxylase